MEDDDNDPGLTELERIMFRFMAQFKQIQEWDGVSEPPKGSIVSLLCRVQFSWGEQVEEYVAHRYGEDELEKRWQSPFGLTDWRGFFSRKNCKVERIRIMRWGSSNE